MDKSTGPFFDARSTVETTALRTEHHQANTAVCSLKCCQTLDLVSRNQSLSELVLSPFGIGWSNKSNLVLAVTLDVNSDLFRPFNRSGGWADCLQFCAADHLRIVNRIDGGSDIQSENARSAAGRQHASQLEFQLQWSDAA